MQLDDVRARAAAVGGAHDPDAGTARHAVAGDPRRDVTEVPGAVGADGRAGVLLQREVLFTYELGCVYGVASTAVGYYLLPLKLGNFLGPLLIGRLFDSVGRRPLVTSTYEFRVSCQRRHRL